MPIHTSVKGLLLVALQLASIVIVMQNNLLADCTQFSVGIEHDMTKPTYGLQGQSSSSVHYDDKNGLNLRGTISDLLGPPIKIANGFNNIFQGSNMAGLGTSLKSGGALLGVDAKLLEAAGGANMLKGGILLGGSAAKSVAAGAVAGPVGKKIANIIELPVKVVAMKDLATGKALTGLARVKQTEALMADAKGQAMIREGTALKTQGLNQVVQGASEGVQNIGNMVQKTAENVGTAFRYLPLILDMQQQQQSQDDATKGGQQVQQHQQHFEPVPHQMSAPATGSLTGGSLFGGLSSLLPGLNANDPLGLTGSANNRAPFGNLFSSTGPNPTYAAVLNSSSPLTNLLLNPGANPFLLPFSGGPLVQAFAGKQPIGTQEAAASGHNHNINGQTSSYNYNLFPGIRVSETTSSQLPTMTNKFGAAAANNNNNNEQHYQPQQTQQQKVEVKS